MIPFDLFGRTLRDRIPLIGVLGVLLSVIGIDFGGRCLCFFVDPLDLGICVRDPISGLFLSLNDRVFVGIRGIISAGFVFA